MTNATSVEPTADAAMQLAKELVGLERRRKAAKSDLADIEADIKVAKLTLRDYMENEQFPMSSKVDGASVFHRTQIWAGPAEVLIDGQPAKDHARLTRALISLGLDDLAPKTVNSQTLSSYVREEIDKVPRLDVDTGELLDLEQRAARALPPVLFDALKITEKHEAVVNGA